MNVSSNVDGSDHPLMKKTNGNKVLLIALASNRGLCGGFNSAVIKEIKKTIQNDSENDYTILPVGKKAFDAFKKSDLIAKHDLLLKIQSKYGITLSTIMRLPWLMRLLIALLEMV